MVRDKINTKVKANVKLKIYLETKDFMRIKSILIDLLNVTKLYKIFWQYQSILNKTKSKNKKDK